VSSYSFPDPRAGPSRQITVHLHRPAAFAPGNPVLVVMHGRTRNGADYRDFFIEPSERYGFLVVAPEFDEAQYAHPLEYNYGAMWRADGSFAPRSEWLFPVVDAVFANAAGRMGSTRGRYFLFGHSAGSQVVHRLVTFAWSPAIEGVVAANAGSYVMPTMEEDFPFGLRGAPVVDLPALFSRPMTIHLGGADNDPNHHQLPREPGAMRQGAHRFARGQRYFEAARSAAARLGVPFAWRLAIAPGVEHSGRDMAPFAARELFGA
jgi:poly(3-hydroxybutyrate) depolymerase